MLQGGGHLGERSNDALTIGLRPSALSEEVELPRFRGRFVFRDSSSLSVGLFEVDG